MTKYIIKAETTVGNEVYYLSIESKRGVEYSNSGCYGLYDALVNKAVSGHRVNSENVPTENCPFKTGKLYDCIYLPVINTVISVQKIEIDE